MPVYNRNGVQHIEFDFQNETYKRSTKQGNRRVAEKIESDWKTNLAEGKNVFPLDEIKARKSVKDFIEKDFEPWARAKYEINSPRTWRKWYRNNLRAILRYPELADLPIDKVTSQNIDAFSAFRQAQGLEASSVNSSLRLVRRMFRKALQWGVIPTAPKIEFLPGEKNRERVITPTEEAKYLTAVDSELFQYATILFQTGMRPDECNRLAWENIRWEAGRYGALFIAKGKTAKARRVIPMSPTVREVLEARFKAAGEPVHGWVFASGTKTGHAMECTWRKRHVAAFVTMNKYAAEHNEKPVLPFVIYSIRHTFLTRLGMSGCDVWTLARIAGHSSIKMSERYVHSNDDAAMRAVENLSAFSGKISSKNPPNGADENGGGCKQLN